MPKKELPTLEQRPLGRTGRPTSILALGTSRLARAGQKEAIRMVREAIDHFGAIVALDEGRDGFVVSGGARRVEQFLRHA